MSALTHLTRLAKKAIRRRSDTGLRDRFRALLRELAGGDDRSLGELLRGSRELLAMYRAEGLTHPDECLLLRRLASEVTDGVILEVGSYRGRSTIALAIGSKRGAGAPVYAIEPHEPFEGVLGGTFGPRDRVAFFRNVLKARVVEIVRLVNLSSEAISSTWERPIALLWIDGDHRREAVERDLACWEPYLTSDSRVVFDDSDRPGVGPYEVVQDLVASGRYRRLEGVGKVTVLAREAEPSA